MESGLFKIDHIKPTVSVLIPIYNGLQFFENLITQINKFPPYVQIILVNDGSTDVSKEVFNLFFQKIPNCILIHQSHLGLVHALNNGLSNCSTDFVARLDIDDEYINGRFENQFEFPNTKKFLLESDYQEIGIAEVEGMINGCPAQVIVQHFAGYKPPNYSQLVISSWKQIGRAHV